MKNIGFFQIYINITAWNLKKTRIEVHKPINSFASGFTQHFRLIQAPNSAFFRLNCLFQFRYLQNTHFLSDSKDFTCFEAQNTDARSFLPFRKKKNVFCTLNAVALIFRIVFLQKKSFCLNILKKNTFSSEPGRLETIFAKKCFFYIYICTVLL